MAHKLYRFLRFLKSKIVVPTFLTQLSHWPHSELLLDRSAQTQSSAFTCVLYVKEFSFHMCNVCGTLELEMAAYLCEKPKAKHKLATFSTCIKPLVLSPGDQIPRVTYVVWGIAV